MWLRPGRDEIDGNSFSSQHRGKLLIILIAWEKFGNKGWGYKDLLPCIQRTERSETFTLYLIGIPRVIFNFKNLSDSILLLHKLSKTTHLQRINLGTERMVSSFYILFVKGVSFCNSLPIRPYFSLILRIFVRVGQIL